MQFYTSILSAVSFIFFLFTVNLFFTKNKYQSLNRLLSIIIFSRFGQIIVFLLVSNNLLTIFPFFYLFFIPLYYAAPACLYLYIRGLTFKENKFKKQDWLHFIPAFILIIHALSALFIKDINWDSIAKEISKNRQLYIDQNTGFLPSYIHSVGLRLILFTYLLLSWIVVIKAKIFYLKDWSTRKTWIIFCLLLSTFFKGFEIIPIFQSFNQSLNSTSLFIILNSIGLICIITFIFHKPHLLYKFLFVGVKLKEKSNQKLFIDLENEETDKELNELQIKYEGIITPQKPKLNEAQIKTFKEKIDNYMILEKPFLSQDFQIVHLAKAMELPVHYCSYIINYNAGKNFRDFINSYRINHFIKEYPLKNQMMTIQAIAFDSGFKSLGTFYNAFKKETGLTPTIYFSIN